MSVFRPVPVLPVVVPLAVLALATLLVVLRRRGTLTVPRSAVGLALAVYVAGIVANTVFPIYLDLPTRDTTWSTGLNLEPLVGYEPADAVTNVLVFVPLGLLVALVFPRGAWLRAVLAAAAVSLTIEAVQLVTARTLGAGHVADVNDLFFNVVGGAVGVGLLALLSHDARLHRPLDRFRWT
ncbi:MAG: VanZ family protein [Aeromicrobium erythreum]